MSEYKQRKSFDRSVLFAHVSGRSSRRGSRENDLSVRTGTSGRVGGGGAREPVHGRRDDHTAAAAALAAVRVCRTVSRRNEKETHVLVGENAFRFACADRSKTVEFRSS